MSTPAEKLLLAFIEVFSRNNGYVVLKHRGGKPGYVHVLPSGVEPTRRESHLLALELHNGTVAVTDELKELLGADSREDVRIEDDDLGFSAGPKFGRFKWALSHDKILAKWGDEVAFAEVAHKYIVAAQSSTKSARR